MIGDLERVAMYYILAQRVRLLEWLDETCKVEFEDGSRGEVPSDKLVSETAVECDQRTTRRRMEDADDR